MRWRMRMRRYCCCCCARDGSAGCRCRCSHWPGRRLPPGRTFRDACCGDAAGPAAGAAGCGVRFGHRVAGEDALRVDRGVGARCGCRAPAATTAAGRQDDVPLRVTAGPLVRRLAGRLFQMLRPLLTAGAGEEAGGLTGLRAVIEFGDERRLRHDSHGSHSETAATRS